MKKRIISFVLTLVLLFNAFAVISFAAEGDAQDTAAQSATAEESKFVPMTGAEVLEAVGTDSFMGGSDFSSYSKLTDYAALWSDTQTYYEADGTEITDPDRLEAIKTALQRMGKRLAFSTNSKTSIDGNVVKYTNNAGVINFVDDGENSYISLNNPILYEDYKNLVGVSYGDNKTVLLRSESSSVKYDQFYDKYYLNSVYTETELNAKANIAALVAAGTYNKSFAISADVMIGDLAKAPANSENSTFISVAHFTTTQGFGDVSLTRLYCLDDGSYKFEYRTFDDISEKDPSWKFLDIDFSTTDFTRVTLLINPVENTYDIMVDGVIMVKNAIFLNKTGLDTIYTVDGEAAYIPARSRSFYTHAITDTDDELRKFDYLSGKTNYSIDNLMFYYTDKFIECAHKYVEDADFCARCEQCGETVACFDDGIEHIYADGKFDSRIKLSTYYNTEEDKANGISHQRLGIGGAKTFTGTNLILALNNRMGMYDFNGDDLVIGKPVSEDYYKLNVGDTKQMNEVYLVYKNAEIQSISSANDAVITEAVEKYKGQSFIVSGSIKGASTSGLAEGVSELSIGLLSASCFRFATKSDSLTGVTLVNLTVTEDENGAPVYTLETSKSISTDGVPYTIGTVSTEDYTDVAAFVDPKTNSVEIYLNGERVLEDKELVFIKGGESNADWIKYIKNATYGINKPEDFVLTSTKLCSISGSNYANVADDVLYVDRFDIAYADSYTENVLTYKDGVCDKCGKTMLEVEERNVTLGDSIALNFHVDVADNVLDNASVTITNGKNTVTYAASEGAVARNFGVRAYSFEMTAIDMTRPVTVRLSVGEAASAAYTTTVADYALDLIADESQTAEAKALAKAMLNYGAAAQVYFANRYNDATIAAELANAGLSEADRAVTAPEISTLPTPSIVGTYPNSASFVLEDKLVLKVYFIGNGEGYTATVTKDEAAVEIGEFYVDEANGIFAVVIDGILPNEYGTEYTVTLADENGTVSTVTVSVNAMIGLLLSNDTLEDCENYHALGEALYDYYVKACAYAG